MGEFPIESSESVLYLDMGARSGQGVANHFSRPLRSVAIQPTATERLLMNYQGGCNVEKALEKMFKQWPKQ